MQHLLFPEPDDLATATRLARDLDAWLADPDSPAVIIIRHGDTDLYHVGIVTEDETVPIDIAAFAMGWHMSAYPVSYD